MSPSQPTLQEESAHVFHEVLLNDARLALPAKVRELAKKTVFNSLAIPTPYIPVPLKVTESSAALWALAATYANAIVRERYAIEQSATVNTDLASLFLVSGLVARVDGKPLTDADLAARYSAYDLGHIFERWRFNCTNVYPTRDGRFFHLHGSLNSDKTLTMMRLPLYRPEMTDEMEIIQEYCKAVSQHDSQWLDVEANEHWRQAGTICLTPDEFRASEQGKAIANDAIYSLEQVDKHNLPPVPYVSPGANKYRPLEGIKILDISRVIAAPTISKLAALYGATVLRVSCASEPELGLLLVDGNLGKLDTSINLKSTEGKKQFLELLQDADVVIDGYRPGALEKLGFGPRYLREIAKRRQKGIVILRENCYGWHGPEVHRSGWQQISDCFTGVSWLVGRFFGLDEPVVPPLPNSDYQTGIIGLIGILAAVDRRANEGGSYLIDVSLNQYNQFLLSLGEYPEETQAALRAQHQDLKLRHYHTIFTATQKMIASLQSSVPSLFKNSNWGNIDSDFHKEGGMLEKLTYVLPPTTFDKTKPAYDVGSCFPGTHEPRWP
ncbi:CAIB BAIF family enzyme [Fusarium mundagurra]|uniref:CAIB BAIF family enzyme n=1 Tax=Fusarium mundagurra TaxID=1567541 RepID=A0A8H6D1B8_9HYPO|nr:CAIB BAIF family enzyme [Fusarium mundagurra]